MQLIRLLGQEMVNFYIKLKDFESIIILIEVKRIPKD